MFSNQHIFDAHIHANPFSDDLDECIEGALDYLSFTGISGANILLLRGSLTPLGNDSIYLYLKHLHPDKFSVYNGLAIGFDSIPYDADGLVTQIHDMMDVGFDGLKIISTGSTQASWGFEFDDPRMDPMWDFLEETQYPITWHVGNTERWPAQRGPKSDILRKKPFTPGNEPNNDPLYARLEHVLQKHPRLHLMIPHWLFMCENLSRLDAFMQAHPNVWIDVCPGSGMLYYMGLKRDQWHDFVIRYQDRMVFGTDNLLDHIAGALELQLHLRRFLETDKTFFTPFDGGHSWGFDITGIGPFSDEVLKKLYRENFLRFRGPVRPINVANAIRYLEKESTQLEHLSEQDAPLQGRYFVQEVIRRLKQDIQEGK